MKNNFTWRKSYNIFLSVFLSFLLGDISDLKAQQSSIGDEAKESLEKLQARLENRFVTVEEPVLKPISLRAVIEEGLRENPEEKIRQYEQKIVEILSSRNRDRFWIPNLNFVFKSSNQRVASLRNKDDRRTTNKSPTGKVGLEVSDYTVFNWGRDYLDYKINDESYKRRVEHFFEQRIALRFELILAYFTLMKSRHEERVAKDFVRRTTFLYRMGREKTALRKMEKGQYFQTRNQYLVSQLKYNSSRINSKSSEKDLSFLIGDNPLTSYTFTENLKYKELTISLPEILALTQTKNFEIKERETAYENSKLLHEKTVKDNLPLPKFSLTLGQYLNEFDSKGATTDYTTSSGGENIEVVAKIDLVWNIFGEKGVFNTRERMEIYYRKLISKLDLDQTKKGVENLVRKKYMEIIELEEQMKIVMPLYQSAKKGYDIMLDEYLAGKVTFLEIKDAVNELKEFEELTEEVKLHHLKAKLELAVQMGIEDFPGENFEMLAIKDEE